MMCNNNWYLFFRLHHLLCERLTKLYNQAVIIASEESKDKKDRKECTAVALRLKPKSKLLCIKHINVSIKNFGNILYPLNILLVIIHSIYLA